MNDELIDALKSIPKINKMYCIQDYIEEAESENAMVEIELQSHSREWERAILVIKELINNV